MCPDIMVMFSSDDNEFQDDSSSKHTDQERIEKLKEQVRSFANTGNLDKGLKKIIAEDQKEVLGENAQETLTLAEALLKQGLITRGQLDIALKEVKESKQRRELGTVLVELNFITESVLTKVMSESSGIESVDLKDYPLNSDLISKIPRVLAMQFKVVPLQLIGDELQVATHDVYNVLGFDQIKRHFGKNVRIKPYFADEFQISEVIDHYYDYDVDIQTILKEIEKGEYQLKVEDNSYINPTVRLVDSLLMDAIKQGASDIHLEPEHEFVRVRYRIDGVLSEMFSFHKEFWSAIIVRIKVMAGLNIAETRNPQDGRFMMMFLGRKVDFRLSIMPTAHGENVVLRILDRKKSLLTLESLGLASRQLKMIKKMLKRPEGIIILTGPTGSGKTTTLYSMISHINSIETNIMTLEDPIEYVMPLVRQSSVREGSNMTFAHGIRTMMRQDPDVIFVGEVRDLETAEMAIRAAMTGHQVFTTLHTADAIGAIFRMSDLGIKTSILAGTITAIIAKRLVRKLCDHCKIEYVPQEHERAFLGLGDHEDIKIFKHNGCPRCNNKGYKGRVGVYEILPIDRELDDLISKEASRKDIFTYARSKGFKTLADEAVELIKAGETDIVEAINNIDMTERMENADLFI